MQKALKDPIKVPFTALYPDPNNPRLSPDGQPDYSDPNRLFNDETRESLTQQISDKKNNHSLAELVETIKGQGWMPIDSILVWEHPQAKGKYVVVEGNRRRTALSALRDELSGLKAQFERQMNTKRASEAVRQEKLNEIAQIQRIVEDTDEITVIPVNAATHQELMAVLPGILGVRHITGSKSWGGAAQDKWLLTRYEHLYLEKHPDQKFSWDDDLIARVATEASIKKTEARNQLKTALMFSHFCTNYEDQLPEGDELGDKDQYLFELIVGTTSVREALGYREKDLYLSDEAEKAIFEWVFKLARGANNNSEENLNVFHAHRNISEWGRMKKFDTDNKTDFFSRYDIAKPESAPNFAELLLDFKNAKANKSSSKIFSQCIEKLQGLTEQDLRDSNIEVKTLLRELERLAGRCYKMTTV